MTNAELIRALRKPGRIYLPVLIPHDVKRIEVVKADVLEILRDLPPEAEAYWEIIRDDGDSKQLDVAS